MTKDASRRAARFSGRAFGHYARSMRGTDGRYSGYLVTRYGACILVAVHCSRVSEQNILTRGTTLRGKVSSARSLQHPHTRAVLSRIGPISSPLPSVRENRWKALRHSEISSARARFRILARGLGCCSVVNVPASAARESSGCPVKMTDKE